jgi:hypothetical protein
MIRRRGWGWAWLVCGILLAVGSVAFGAAAQPERPFTLIAGGDVLLDRGVRDALRYGDDPHDLFSGIAPILREADLAFANLECALVDSGVPILKQFMLRGDVSMARVLAESGFKAMTLANNHAYDYGRDALMETVANLEKAGVASIGVGPNLSEACRVRFVTVRGIRVALLGFVSLPLEGLMPLPELPGPAMADPEQMLAAVRKARANADLVVVTMHWGREYSTLPSESQMDLASQLAQAGADVIVGHHPHVVQSVERIGRCVVLYSVGNLVFDSARPDASVGLLVRIQAEERSPVNHVGDPGSGNPGTSDSSPAGDSRGPRDSNQAGGEESKWSVGVLPVVIEACRPRPAEPEKAAEIVRVLGSHSRLEFAGPESEGWWIVPPAGRE